MHRRATCKVQASELEDPAGGIPCPASDRVIDDRAPDKGEDHGREHTAAFSSGTDGKCYTFGLLVALSLSTTGMLELETHVIAANIPWNTAKSRSGTLGLPTEGAARTSLKPKFDRSPMYFPAVWEKASE